MFKAETVPKPGDERVSTPAVSNRFVRSFLGMPETDGVLVPQTIRNFREPPVGGGQVNGPMAFWTTMFPRAASPRPMKPSWVNFH